MLVLPAELAPQALYHPTVPLIHITPQPGQPLHGYPVGLATS